MSDANLYEAHYQWAHRPDDERYDTVANMRDACRAYADSAVVAYPTLGSLRVESTGDDLVLIGKSAMPAKLTHYAFGQLSRLVGAPASYLRELPTQLTQTLVNHGIAAKSAKTEGEGKLNLLMHKNGSLVARAITSESYDRVWNWELCDRIQSQLIGNGWRVPPARPARPGQRGTRAATEADILPNQGDFGLSVRVGDQIAPAGLYASAHDMFAFLVDQSQPVSDGEHLMHRGVFVQNSEVGDCSLRFKLFTHDNVCGNHIVWGVGEVTEISVRHVKGDTEGKTLQNAFTKWSVTCDKLPSAGDMEKQIAKAKTYQIAATKDEVLDKLFAFARVKRLEKLNRPALAAAYDIAEKTPRYGSPRSVWAIVNGLTEYSQTLDNAQHADERVAFDTQAGKVMEMAF